MPLVEEIERLLEPYLENGKYFVVSLTAKPLRSTYQVVILLDSDEGITISECASISRRLAHDLESNEIFTDAYNIEVSSPGLDQPLVLPRQFAKNIGRNLKVYLKDGDTVTAKLVSLTDDGLSVELPKPKKKPKKGEEEPELAKYIAFTDVTQAFVEISFK
jgi:ribosome maturation factor RimP